MAAPAMTPTAWLASEQVRNGRRTSLVPELFWSTALSLGPPHAAVARTHHLLPVYGWCFRASR
jgi:hypothetical protein